MVGTGSSGRGARTGPSSATTTAPTPCGPSSPGPPAGSRSSTSCPSPRRQSVSSRDDRPDYGRSPAGFQAEGRRFHGDAGGLHFCVVSTAEIRGGTGGFTLHAGDAVALSLRCQHARGDCTTSESAWTVERALGLLRETQAYWWRWIGKVRYAGAYPEAVWRSALALKLMIYAPTGAIVAAPTASLPEAIGGRRNWDYRFTWLRDASLTLFGLFQLGLHEEADGFFGWLRTTGIGDGGRFQNLYRVDGSTQVTA